MAVMPPSHASDERELTKWQARGAVAAAALVILAAAGLAVYAAAASYASVSHLAATRGVPLPRLNPVGLDGGLAGIITFDIVLTWMRRPIWLLRAAARLFALGTIAANATAGWPDPVGVGLRIAAPVLFVVIVESARAFLLGRDSASSGGIPLARWLLAFRSTFRLWRRMKLWGIRSYAEAVDMELSRLVAIEQLSAKYPDGWQQEAPADLVFMLARGVRMEQALEIVAELTKPAEPEPTAIAQARPAKRAQASAPKSRKGTRQTAHAEDLTTELRALKLLQDEPELRKPRMGAELARRLEVSPATGRRLHARLTAQDRPAEPLSERSPGQPDARSGERS